MVFKFKYWVDISNSRIELKGLKNIKIFNMFLNLIINTEISLLIFAN